MERTQQLQQFWSWLPAFRAVAETEHLPTAAKALHTSASSLSRSVRLLEDALGVPLFDRSGRALRLNDEGRAFLEAVRSAMRGVHDGYQLVRGELLGGDVYLQADVAWLELLLGPAKQRLDRIAPELRLDASTDTDHTAALLRGGADVVLRVGELAPHDSLVQARLASLPRAVFAKSDGAHSAFAAPPAMEGMATHESDGWPSHAERDVGLRANSLGDRLAAARMGFRAVLPSLIGDAAGLERCDTADAIVPADLVAITRRKIAHGGRAAALVEALEDALKSVQG